MYKNALLLYIITSIVYYLLKYLIDEIYFITLICSFLLTIELEHFYPFSTYIYSFVNDLQDALYI